MFDVFLTKPQQGAELDDRDLGMASGCVVSHPAFRDSQTFGHVLSGEKASLREQGLRL
jgi:hypothetical protein